MANKAEQAPDKAQVADYVFDHLAQMVILLEEADDQETAILLDAVVRSGVLRRRRSGRDDMAVNSVA